MEKEERKEGRRERRMTGKRERDNETQRERWRNFTESLAVIWVKLTRKF